jgi:ABC-2 type transport system ATP-binding protein
VQAVNILKNQSSGEFMIEVKNLTKTFKSYERGNNFFEILKGLIIRKQKLVPALKGISFNIAKGELVGFLGPNGAGKSTTLKILTGIMFPTSGDVNIMGYVPWKHRKKYVARIGAVFGQKSQLLWDIPPIDAFYLNKSIYGIPDGEFKKTLGDMIELLGLTDLVKKQTRLLSLGERMKCEFIMAMLHKPDIIFLDEPTIGLDVIAKDKIREFIIDMNHKGTTFILTTHDLGDIEHLAKRIIVINHGEIVFDESIDVLRKYLGNKKMINISTYNPLNLDDIAGLDIIKKISDYEAELVLDISKIELNLFIDGVNKSSIINDLSIHEPPIEDIIKNLYNS